MQGGHAAVTSLIRDFLFHGNSSKPDCMKKMLHTILLTLAATSTHAQSLEDVAQLDVLPGWRGADGTHIAGLRITLAEGWKTYWRAPGDGGIPPEISLSGSENITEADFHWPVPEVFYQSGLRSVGYQSSIVVPMRIDPVDDDGSITVSGTISIGVCEEICIPVEFPIQAVLPPAGSRDSSIVAALINRPQTSEEAGVTAATCRLKPTGGAMELTTRVSLPNLRGDEDIVIETGDPQIWVSEPSVTISNGMIEATSDLVHIAYSSFALDRSAVRITILGSGGAVDVQGCTGG